MSATISVTLTSHGFELRCPVADLSEDRPFASDDGQRFSGWNSRYLQAVRKDQTEPLLALGTDLHAWLEGTDSFLTRALESAAAPLLVEFRISRNDESEIARAFLNAPWELLAQNGEYWALRPDLVFCPIRRIGKPGAPPNPSPNRLGLVFMAAAPHGADNLNYEREETSIIAATRNLGLDLTVEESGTLEMLSACVAREKPDAVQISCHGALHPKPGLLLEDDIGDTDYIEAPKLAAKLAGHHPRLLFLSACETAQADPVLPSLARSLVLAGISNILGWAAPVRDVEATLFAAQFYQRLTAGEDVAHALAYARLELSGHEQLPLAATGPRSRDWHLARLFCNPSGGGALAPAVGKQRHLGHGQAVKTFLDAKGKQVPVAGPLEFVGRRREIQKILRQFRAPADERKTGVFIHGVGRQGKSSLASRVAHRLEHTHETVVIYGRYDAPFILRTIAERLGTREVTRIADQYVADLHKNPKRLLPALTELLEGPCAQAGDHGAKPVLLVIDDFEQAIVAQSGGPHVLKPEYVESIRAVMLAFNAAQTESRLLFTSRFQFTCPHDGRDLADADHLLDVPLRGMDHHESRKQAGAKLSLPAIAKLAPGKRVALVDRIERIIANARGNPGLQDILFALAIESPTACDHCLLQMEEFLKSGTAPVKKDADEQKDAVRAFLENLALKSLTELLSPSGRELLRAATLFELPVPMAVMAKLAGSIATPEAIERLLALGLWEVYEDLHNPQTPALAINALVRPLAGELIEAERIALAQIAVDELFQQWGGTNERRGLLQDHELTRLGLVAHDAPVLVACGAAALRFLENQFEYRRAAEWAEGILATVDAAGLEAPVSLLRAAAASLTRVGEVTEARRFLDRALAANVSGKIGDELDHLATLADHARALVREGNPDDALKIFEQVRNQLPEGTSRAAVLGEIARLRANRGEVDAALKLHEEELSVYEVLGDKRSRAVTLGDIARLQAVKGEVDAALKFHEEQLDIFEVLGEKRERAVALGGIARLRAARGEVDAALKSHEERLCIFEVLGDKRERAITLGDIARLRAAKGDADAALKLHEEELSVYEALGEKRLRAVTLGDIAYHRAAKGEVDAALKLLEEALSVHEALGDLDSKANAFWAIARIEMQQENWQEAFNHLDKSYSINLKLGRLDGICFVGVDLGQLFCAAGQREQGLQILNQSLQGFQKLGRLNEAARAQAIIDAFTQSGEV